MRNLPGGMRTNLMPIGFSKATGSASCRAASICAASTFAQAGCDSWGVVDLPQPETRTPRRALRRERSLRTNARLYMRADRDSLGALADTANLASMVAS